MKPVCLSIEDLSVSLPSGGDRAMALSNVSLDVREGEILCVVGESGSGKSMCANAAMGLLPRGAVATTGRILLQGEDLLRVDEARMRRLRGDRIAMIFQEPMTALNPLMRVEDQLIEAFEVHERYRPAEYVAEVKRLLASVDLPEPETLRRAYPFQLSGGQRQRVLIAMSLAFEPAVLIADEPTTALDVSTQARILQLIRDQQQGRPMGVVFITHDFGVVADIADRVVVMRQGLVVETGSVQQILTEPREDYTKSLIAAVPSMNPPARKRVHSPLLLSVKGLNKTFSTGGGFGSRRRKVAAARDVSFDLHVGETVGVVGESGSGKSTLGRLVMRLLEPDAGTISIENKDIARLGGKKLRQGREPIQFVFQDPFGSLNPRHSVGRAIADGMHARGIDARTAAARCVELLEQVGLGASALNRYPHEFSGGQRQRIAIARALATSPRLLIADEAVSALDVSVQAQVLELLTDLQERLQLSMLFITHDLRVAAQMCDRILVMHRGEVVEQGSTREIFANPGHAYTRGLLEALPGRVARW